ncbi:HlyD family efflux transporter periplasmic adaptor subunit [Romeria aff. gracilis LEGE 07310]|uniref:HlyD family efflux transporter periplasmic adaptor subunit n=1 Tax=Vasconcelosia minhoensis LEGE 07310 TaxID=915328 RepID=A0A8J7ASL3_9CYAN|nr:HlyD family efflux transporter periplasmic adaptor subunit [Romeria gracilis]MBE9079575.1 HlyD family efflux transporter periplasmic adaptor subunit [Romeria aff. gracilis LEGE 07310]
MQQRSEMNETLNSNAQKLEQVTKDLMRTELKAPTAGTIQALSLRNTNQVIRPGETVAKIFPDGAELKVQALVPGKEISKVSVDQPVKMRISACPFSQFGTLPGVVRTISPDANSTPENENNGLVGDTFYNVMVEPQRLTLKAGDKECPIRSGIEGRAEIIAREETIFDFILRKSSLVINR